MNIIGLIKQIIAEKVWQTTYKMGDDVNFTQGGVSRKGKVTRVIASYPGHEARYKVHSNGSEYRVKHHETSRIAEDLNAPVTKGLMGKVATPKKTGVAKYSKNKITEEEMNEISKALKATYLKKSLRSGHELNKQFQQKVKTGLKRGTPETNALFQKMGNRIRGQVRATGGSFKEETVDENRFHVVRQTYSLDAGKIGTDVEEKIISKHRSPKAAGKKLGSMISGKMSKTPDGTSQLGRGVRMVARDTTTGKEFPRNALKNFKEEVIVEGAQPGTPEWLKAKSSGPKWKYHDARGVEHKGYMEKYIDRGGTDHTAYMRHHETGELSLVSGQRLKDMSRIWKEDVNEGRVAVPLGKDHPYHSKSDAELHYIARDAGAAAKASKGLSSYDPNTHKRIDTEGKYLDQMNDAHTVLHYRRNGGKIHPKIKTEEVVNEKMKVHSHGKTVGFIKKDDGGFDAKIKGGEWSLPIGSKHKAKKLIRKEVDESTVVIHHHPDYDEYRVPNKAKGKGAGYFTNDKADAVDTAKHIHGKDAIIKIRSKRYNTEETLTEKEKKGVSWNPPEVQAKAAREKKEAKQFASAKREIKRLKARGEGVIRKGLSLAEIIGHRGEFIMPRYRVYKHGDDHFEVHKAGMDLHGFKHHKTVNTEKEAHDEIDADSKREVESYNRVMKG